MSTVIILEDGRVWRVANWAHDSIVEAIATALDDKGVERPLQIGFAHKLAIGADLDSGLLI